MERVFFSCVLFCFDVPGATVGRAKWRTTRPKSLRPTAKIQIFHTRWRLKRVIDERDATPPPKPRTKRRAGVAHSLVFLRRATAHRPPHPNREPCGGQRARVGARPPFFVFCLHLFTQKAQNTDGQNFTGEGKGVFSFTGEVLKSPESSRVSFSFSTHCG